MKVYRNKCFLFHEHWLTLSAPLVQHEHRMLGQSIYIFVIMFGIAQIDEAIVPLNNVLLLIHNSCNMVKLANDDEIIPDNALTLNP
jgi:hypothetical protein